MSWNILPFIEVDAATQMATDVILLRRCEDEPNTGYLRFYRMNPSAVTIGRHQRWARVIDPTICARNGWDWMRRPTGGGALLHLNELNYAVVLGRSARAELGLTDFRSAFGWIAENLAMSLSLLDIETDVSLGRSGPPVAPETAESRQHGLCGRSLTRYEVSRQGGKLIAAAQMVSAEGVLQHGTLYLKAPTGKDRFWPNDLAVSDESKPDDDGGSIQRWADLTSGLAERSAEDVAQSLALGFIRAAGIEMLETTLSSADRRMIADCRMSWSQTGWNERK